MKLHWNLDSSTSIALDVIGEDGLPEQAILSLHVPFLDGETGSEQAKRIQAWCAKLNEGALPPWNHKVPLNITQIGQLMHYLSFNLIDLDGPAY